MASSRALHTTHHSTFSTMAADQWLLDLDADSTRAVVLRNAAASWQHTQGTVPIDPGEQSTDEEQEEEEFDEEEEVDDNMDLASYGPTTEELRAHVQEEAAKAGSDNTAKQYGRLVTEYKEFAQVIFHDDAITVDRVFKFLQFQAHREKRNNKEPDDEPEVPALEEESQEKDPQEVSPPKKRQRRSKKTNSTRVVKYKFNVDDYKKVMDHIQNDIHGIDPKQWVHWNRVKSIDKYYSALLWGSTDEMAYAIQNSKSIKTLKNNVNARTKMSMVMNDEDDLNKTTEQFRYPQLYLLTEEWLWDEYKNNSNWKYLTRSLRDRYTLLMTVQTCTRHEATLSCMLQTFEVAVVTLNDELQTYPILTRNIYKGKTNQEHSKTIIQAKSIRHKNVNCCEQGALAMYLFARFKAHDEDFDLSHNSNWMKIKTTVPVNNSKKQFTKTRFQRMSPSSYYSKIEKVFKYFGYSVSHVVHFGRSCTPVLLEFAEVMVEQIGQLGSWDFRTYHKAYSLNLPWDALRAAAGFRKDKGFYRVPRMFTEVPSELKRKVYPNIERSRLQFMSFPENVRNRLPMATKFLRVMDYLAEVFVQDVCAMRFHGRTSHQLFSDSFFQDPDFIKYEETFRANYTIAIDPRNDPTLDPIRKAAPMMAHHLGHLSAFTHQGFRQQNQDMTLLRQEQCQLWGELRQHLQLQAQQSQVFMSTMSNVFRVGHEALSGVAAVSPTNALTHSPTKSPPNPTANQVTPREDTTDPQDDDGTSTNSFPDFDRLAYDSVEVIYDDWFGDGNSEYQDLGGIKSLYNNRAWRKSLGNNKSKREADKKMLQKFKRIGEYMQDLRMDGQDRDDVISHINGLLSSSPKSTPSLTGIAKLLKSEAANTDE